MDVATLREQLVEERERLERELRRVARDRGRPAHEDAEEEPVAPADAAERELDESLELNAEAVLAEIRRALERIETGTYGTCASCQRPIAEARLSALPYANRCIDCKRLEERG